MRSSFPAETGRQLLSAVAWLGYSASLAAVFATGYALIVLVLQVAGQHIGSMHSPHGF